MQANHSAEFNLALIQYEKIINSLSNRMDGEVVSYEMINVFYNKINKPNFNQLQQKISNIINEEDYWSLFTKKQIEVLKQSRNFDIYVTFLTIYLLCMYVKKQNDQFVNIKMNRLTSFEMSFGKKMGCLYMTSSKDYAKYGKFKFQFKAFYERFTKQNSNISLKKEIYAHLNGNLDFQFDFITEPIVDYSKFERDLMKYVEDNNLKPFKYEYTDKNTTDENSTDKKSTDKNKTEYFILQNTQIELSKQLFIDFCEENDIDYTIITRSTIGFDDEDDINIRFSEFNEITPHLMFNVFANL